MSVFCCLQHSMTTKLVNESSRMMCHTHFSSVRWQILIPLKTYRLFRSMLYDIYILGVGNTKNYDYRGMLENAINIAELFEQYFINTKHFECLKWKNLILVIWYYMKGAVGVVHLTRILNLKGQVTHIYVNELCHNWFRSWLVARLETNHYLNQYKVTVNWAVRNKIQRYFKQSWKKIIQENTFENVVCKMATNLVQAPMC